MIRSRSRSRKFQDRDGDGDRRKGGRGKRGGGGRNFRRDGQGGGGNRSGDRRGGGGGKFQGKGGRGGHGHREDRRKMEVPAPEGFTAKTMPGEEALDLLAKEIMATGRTYSVFDLAKVLLQGRDRFRVTFENKEQTFFRCKKDHSIWLSKDEAVRHLWKSDWRNELYAQVETEGEAPSGNFQTVARCGLSGEYLGPPNYHGYQQNLVALHRERFGHMPLESYKAKVKMERGEEAVEAWLESAKKVLQWKLATGEEATSEPEEGETPENVEASSEESAPEEPAAEAEIEETPAEVRAEDAQKESENEPEETQAEGDAPSVEEAAESEPAASDDSEGVLFKEAREVEQHFRENYFEEIFEEVNRAWVLGDIKGNLLSPGLLTLLKHTVMEEKRYPANLIPIVCRQLSGRHVAVFKWQKKLKAGPSRPHAVSTEISLAERPQQILDYLKENSGRKLDKLWKAVMPEDASDEVKHEWYHDLHWLLNQGHVILLSDGGLFLSKPGGAQGPPVRKATRPKKKAASAKAEKAPDKAKANAEVKEELAASPLPSRGRRPVTSHLGRVMERAERTGMLEDPDSDEDDDH